MTTRLDHVEVRVSNPEEFAKILVGLFGGSLRVVNPNLIEYQLGEDATFLEIKLGNPRPLDQRELGLSRLGFSVGRDGSGVLLPRILQVDPEAKDLGIINLPEPAHRIIQFQICGIYCQLVERC